MNISACGLICDQCHFFNKECAGCFNLKGKPFWTEEDSANGVCALFDCSINQKGYLNCGDCIDLPCKMFVDLKDPNISEEDHQKQIQQRIKILRKS